MKKKIQKPFNVEAAKNGATVETKSGRSVRIICYNKKGIYPIVALIAYGDDEIYFNYNVEGKYIRDRCSDDLVIVEEVECPKFKVGEVIVAPACMYPWFIIGATSDYYMLQDTQGNEITTYNGTIDTLYRLWTPKDAKPGDVLVCENDNRPFIFKGLYYDDSPIAYCGIDTTNSIYISDDSNPWTHDVVSPATKKERDTLFKKMEEAGYKWDVESLTLSKIQKRWRGDESAKIDGYFVNNDSQITNHSGWNICINHNLFATEKQAKSALAMAQISQIMVNDGRFGGVVTDEEWGSTIPYFVIVKVNNMLAITTRHCYEYLAFHTREQAELFLKENEDLVKDYYIMD